MTFILFKNDKNHNLNYLFHEFFSKKFDILWCIELVNQLETSATEKSFTLLKSKL